MEPVLERLPSGARIAVIRLRSLGDCVLTTPALRLLKSQRPDLELAVVVEDRFAAVFENNPDVQQTIAPRATAMARWRPELCINLHGGTRSIVLTQVSRARLRAGFAHYRAQCTYNIHIPSAQTILGCERKVHTAEHLASAMFYLGVRPQEIPPARLFAQPSPRPRPYAVLHPFASTPAKTWPAERFIAVARHLEQAGIQPLALCGPGEDPARFTDFEIVSGASLRQAIALIQGSALFIGNDSGPAHIAAACGTPLVVLFGASDADIWAPWKAPASAQLARPAITDIAVDEVLRAAQSLGVPA